MALRTRGIKNTASEIDKVALELPFSLYLSFADVAGVPIKFCGIDGQVLSGIPAFPAVGPCAVLNKGSVFAEACAGNHAAAATMAAELRRPYIFTCHVRLAGWAVPILHNGEPLPAAIICGGVLLIEPDIALVRHVESVAVEHDVEPAELVQSLDSVPVLSRERLRAVADFLFRMSAAFAAYASLPGASELVVPAPSLPQAPIVFTRARKKETRKAKAQRARLLELQSVEAEIVRLV
ncbi:MAG: PocR ligand-binding domain-containing protein, partial [Candidatus Hydrogenedentota bacterium]